MNHSTLRVSHSIDFQLSETCPWTAGTTEESPDILDTLSRELCYPQGLSFTVPVVSPQAQSIARCTVEWSVTPKPRRADLKQKRRHHADLLQQLIEPEQWRQLETWCSMFDKRVYTDSKSRQISKFSCTADVAPTPTPQSRQTSCSKEP